MAPFPRLEHLASWACLCPGNNITGGKRRSGKTRRGQNWLRAAFVEAAWGAAHTRLLTLMRNTLRFLRPPW